MALQADSLAPDSAYGPSEDRPGRILLDIQKARSGQGSGVVQASGVLPLGDQRLQSTPPGGYPGTQMVYDPSTDATRNVLATDNSGTRLVKAPEGIRPPEPLPTTDAVREVARPGESGSALRLYDQGMKLLRDGDSAGAYDYFKQAYAFKNELDPPTQARLQQTMQMLAAQAVRRKTEGPDSLLDSATAKQEMLVKQIAADVNHQLSIAMSMKERDPKGAVELLQKTRASVEGSALEPNQRAVQLKRIDLGIADVEKYIKANLAQIDFDQRNKAVRDSVDQRRLGKIEAQEKVAVLVDQFNKKMEEHSLRRSRGSRQKGKGIRSR